MQRQLELPPDVALVDGVEIEANLLRSQNTGTLAGLANVSSRYHRSRVHRCLLHFDRVVEHLFHHAAKLHGSGNAAMIALAVNNRLNIQGGNFFERLASQRGINFIV